MKPAAPKPQRCAVYTRKSTDHNLDLAFNSLDAQREACEAYIKSQAHEGWKLISDQFNDGAFSGASLVRPALQELLDVVRARRVDIIVVYKVDRLTRSLADFAKLVELFDEHEVSFVSVTQSFNTTSSMGRLTLNVLLSFAQFEREVIGERVRDKISASKRRGIWVGGPIPLGYRSVDKKLEIVPEEAALVRKIFSDYLRLGSVGELAASLEREGIKPRPRLLANGRTVAAERFMVGPLAHLLKNRFYIGEVVYQGETNPGEHEPILERELFEAVQSRMADKKVLRQQARAQSPALLMGLIFDDRGNPMSPSHANKKGVRYRYYVSHALLQNRKNAAGSVRRVSAPDVGGGFGVKNCLYPEWVMLLWCARKLGRSVKWVEDRAEDFVSTAQGRDNVSRARLALEFAWLPGGWDADQDGVMEGVQHNTMDVEYFGPNPQMASWYLGALRAAEEMAAALGEKAFAEKCRGLFERGRAWVDANLFNDDYYEHHLRPAGSWDKVRPGLVFWPEQKNPANPDYQLGAGCLIDQLAGQVNAHFEGLGHLLDPEHEREALRAVLTHNRRHGFEAHFNHMRSYVLGDETALLMASYPRGRRPARPFPYYTEVMTGFEYCVALHLAQEGMVRDALKVVRDIRARYDGRKRNPFDEAECGHHYARALNSWGLIAALTGFHYSALTATLAVAPSPRRVRWFWSAGPAWGTVELAPTRRRTKVTLTCIAGRLRLRRLGLTGFGGYEFSTEKTLAPGRPVTIEIAPAA